MARATARTSPCPSGAFQEKTVKVEEVKTQKVVVG
jgi:hypothetical protein